MTEKDILNKIKESSDEVEIPESLKPEQIELKLKGEKKLANKNIEEKVEQLIENKIPNVKKNSLNITTKSIFKNMKFENIWNIFRPVDEKL